VLVWVDDIIVAASNDHVLCEIKNLLKNRFKMRDLGQLSWFLGIQFICENGCIKVNQTQYLTRLLEKDNMANCKPRPTPCEMKLNFSSNAPSECSVMYREIVGSLIYAMTCTRPDLCWIVTVLSQHLANPSEEHCVVLKHVLCYLKGSLHFELCFRKCDDGLHLTGFSDASWASSDDRKSVTGYCFCLNKNGPLISWKSKKQPTVAPSSCEAEYMALAACVLYKKDCSLLICFMILMHIANMNPLLFLKIIRELLLWLRTLCTINVQNILTFGITLFVISVIKVMSVSSISHHQI